jgi:hypothetical protein
MVIWVIGFVIYRVLMNIDIIIGNTLPDMLITVLICLAVGKILPKASKNQN